jgi:hypothetical protein
MRKPIVWLAIAVCAAALSFAGAQAQKMPIQKQPAPFLRPDLIVTAIDFQKVQSGTDAQGKTYWIFNVTAKVKNQGNGNAGAFKVLIERNNGAGGAYQTACQTCTLDVPGLAAGQEMTTDPRQFNNAMGMPSKFKFTADSAGQISESNEGNNSREEGFISLSLGDVPGGPTPIAKPDLFAVSVSFEFVSQTVVNGKTILTYKAVGKVKNLGPGPAPATELEFDRASDWHVTVPFQYKPVPALAANAEVFIATDNIQHEVGTPGKYYNIIVDPHHTIAEVNENNNWLDGMAIKASLYPPAEPSAVAGPDVSPSGRTGRKPTTR